VARLKSGPIIACFLGFSHTYVRVASVETRPLTSRDNSFKGVQLQPPGTSREEC
jgi:hypothetical protein